MKRPLFSILLSALSSVPSGAQDMAARMERADSALRAGLWEVAALHYESALASKSLGAEQMSIVGIRLAEAWVREGRLAEALELLERSFVRNHPDAAFWKGIALMKSGRLNDALGTLGPYLDKPDSALRAEAGFTIESIQLALGKPEDALATLERLSSAEASPADIKARLHRMEILLDLGRHQEARGLMPPAASMGEAERPAAMFLEAQLYLAEGDFHKAMAGFQSLLDQPKGQSQHRHDLSALGLADALLGLNRAAEAATGLMDFASEHPDSPHLDGLFSRLLECLPAKPTTADPILERLEEWIPSCETMTTGLVAGANTSAASAWPQELRQISPLQGQAMFVRAVGLRRIGTPESRSQASALMRRLYLEAAGSRIADRALFETSRWLMEDGKEDLAFGVLETLRETASSGEMRGKAAFDQASQAYQKGDRPLARKLFEQAAASLPPRAARQATLNAAISILAAAPGSIPAGESKLPEDAGIAVDLELERALSTVDPAARREAIEGFLTKHPDHPRVVEARMAAAEAALSGSHPDLLFARAQLEMIEAADKSGGESAARLAWLRLRIQDRGDQAAATVEAAREFIQRFPADPAVREATFILGRNLFESRNYNDARLTLERLAAGDPESPLAQAAWLLAARAAALVSTSQSQQEALILYDKIIRSKDPSVGALAMLEKGQLLIDMNRLAEAAAFLKPWFDKLKADDPVYLPVGLLLGEAIYAQGSANPDSLTGALAVYDRLLARTEKDPALFNRIQYLRGKTLEQIPEAKDPSRKREKEAFIAYYSVLETSTTPAEWHYFELCGFRALALLEKAGRWPAAIACAKKIASFKGPRAEEAANHASQLQLKHMIWED